jgi:uncharacterized membrane protein
MILSYFSTLIVFLVVDAVWLGVIARGFYAAQMGPLLSEKPNLWIAAVFYLIYVGGITYFAVMPALSDGGLRTAFFNGALLGLIAYGTYDITNLATTRGWPFALAFVDLGWGILLSSVAAAAGTMITRALA